jgi:hypothetical protein
VFQTSFREGNQYAAEAGDSTHLFRRQINMTEHFDVVYATMYFLYTGTFVSGPHPDNMMDIYELSRRLELDDLAETVLGLLKTTCDPMKVVELFMTLPASMYSELSAMYSDIIREHAPKIRKSNNFRAIPMGLEKEDKSEVLRVFSRFVELVILISA